MKEIIITHDNLPRENRELIYHKIVGKTKTWVYPINALSPASGVHCSASSRENEPGYQGFRGYGGSTLTFSLEGGTKEKMTGPWNSSAEALFSDTGVDIRDQYLTYVIIAKKREQDQKYRTIFKDIVYQDKKPMLGQFHRGDLLARELARKNRVKKLYLFRHSMGGSKTSPIYADQEITNGERRKPLEISPEQTDII